MPICRLCGQYAKDNEAVRYSVRHYAHHQCYAESDRPLEWLSRQQIGRFPVRVLRETGRMAEAQAALQETQP